MIILGNATRSFFLSFPAAPLTLICSVNDQNLLKTHRLPKIRQDTLTEKSKILFL